MLAEVRGGRMRTKNKTNSDAAEYHRIRRILFCAINNPTRGMAIARKWLMGYRKSLSPWGYRGLKAELDFWEKYHKTFDLTVAADVGDHADFCGHVKHEHVRFDVTTNASYKSSGTYAPRISGGQRYYVAEGSRGAFIFISPLALKVDCSDCKAKCIKFLHVDNGHVTESGMETCSYGHYVISLCPKCLTVKILKSFPNVGGMPPPSVFERESFEDVEGDDQNAVAESEVERYKSDLFGYYKVQYPDLAGITEKCIDNAMFKYCDEDDCTFLNPVYLSRWSDALKMDRIPWSDLRGDVDDLM